MTETLHRNTLVLGSGGYLGSRIVDSKPEMFKALPVTPIREEVDLARFRSEVLEQLDLNPETDLVNCIGIRSGGASILRLLNAQVPEVLAEIADSRDVQLIHLGSAAEMAQRTSSGRGALSPFVSAANEYGLSKRDGTNACLASSQATVLRVYNLHGLHHPSTSGLHNLCSVVSSLFKNDDAAPIIDTTRDYVHWESVVCAVTETLASRSEERLIELCSGFGISMSEIIREMPGEIQERCAPRLIPADAIGPLVGTICAANPKAPTKSELVRILASEVVSCASS